MQTNAPVKIATVAIALAFATSACQRTPAPQPPQASPNADVGTGERDAPPVGPSPSGVAGSSMQEQRPEDRGHYTPLRGAGCALLDTDAESGGSRMRCPGMGGYRLLVHESDARMSLELVPPRGSPQPLELWQLANGAFSELGERAEWRLDDAGQPHALIVRYNAYLRPEQPTHATSYLVVVRLEPSACIVDVVPPGPAQNQRARDAAGPAAGLACRKPSQH